MALLSEHTALLLISPSAHAPTAFKESALWLRAKALMPEVNGLEESPHHGRSPQDES